MLLKFLDLLITEKEWVQSKLSEYSSSFTIHGLSRTIHTDSHVERLFWIFSLLLALGIAFLMVRSLLTKFWTNDVYWNTESRITNQGNPFPAVTICIAKIKVSNIFCGIPLNDEFLTFFVRGWSSCNKEGFWNEPKNKTDYWMEKWSFMGLNTRFAKYYLIY